MRSIIIQTQPKNRFSSDRQVTWLTIVGLILLLSSQSLWAAPQRSEHFRHLLFRESPFAPYQGIHPIDAATAKQTAHYRFDYDEQNRVVSISHRIGEQLIEDNGNWDTFIWFAPKVTISYRPQQEIHHYFDANDQAATVHGQVFTATYQLDENQQRQQLVFHDQEGNSSENAWGAHRYQWRRDEQNRVVEQRFNLADEMVMIRPNFDFYEIRLQYGQDGRLVFMYNYGQEGKLTNNASGAAIDRIYYDPAGNFQRWQVYNAQREPIEGNIPNVHVGEHLYDSLGNKIGMRGFNRQGETMAFSWGDTIISNDYDRFGNMVRSISYDQNNQATVIAEREYSRDGSRRQLLKIVDEQGQLLESPRLGGAAAIRYEYDKGSQVSSGHTLLDRHLKAITPQQ
jgi:hypothetical protein